MAQATLSARCPRRARAGLSYDYGNVEKVPIPQIFLTLIEAGDTLPSVPPPVLAVIRKAVLPFARLVGYKATYPEYTSTK